MDASPQFLCELPKSFSYLIVQNNSLQSLPAAQSNLINLVPFSENIPGLIPRPTQENVPPQPRSLANLLNLAPVLENFVQDNSVNNSSILGPKPGNAPPGVFFQIPNKHLETPIKTGVQFRPILPKTIENCEVEKEQKNVAPKVGKKREAIVNKEKMPGVSCWEIVEVKILKSEKKTTMVSEGYNFNWKDREKTR